MEHQFVLTRDFHESAVATARSAARRDLAEEARDFVRPCDDRAAVSRAGRIGVNGNIGGDRRARGVLDVRIPALEVAAYQHRAAAARAADVNARAADEAHPVAQDLHRPARSFSPFCLHDARHDGRVFGSDLHLAPARAAGGRDAARFERRALPRRQHDFPALSDSRAVGVDRASLGDQSGEDARPSALRRDPPEIEGLVVRGRDLHPQVRRAGIHQLHRLARREYHLAARAGDEAAVGHVRRDEIDVPSGCGGQAALVDEAARARRLREPHPPGQEIGVAQVERGGDHTRHVDPAVRAEHDAVGIDQEHAPVGLQRTQYLGGVLRDYPVQHRARRGILDEAGQLVDADREALPVDDGVRAVGDPQHVARLLECGGAVLHGRARGIGERTARHKTRPHRNRSQ